MTTLPDAPLTMFGFAKKLIASNNGALIVLSAPPSIGLTEIFDALLEGITLKAILFPFAVSIVTIICYFSMFALDFLYGTFAARKLAGKGNEWFESSKGYSSIFKMFAVVFLIGFLSLFSMIAAIGGWDTVSKVIITLAAVIGLMATLFDFASIGENYKKINGKQSDIFVWLRNITEVIDEGFTGRLKDFFQSKKPPLA